MNEDNIVKIPSRLPCGRRNPEWAKAYRQKRKEAGNPLKTSIEGNKRYRNSPKGKATENRYRNSIKGKAIIKSTRERRMSTIQGGEKYADWIIRQLESEQEFCIEQYNT